MKKILNLSIGALFFALFCGQAAADGNAAGGRSGGGGGSRQDLKEWVDAEYGNAAALDPIRIERDHYCREFTTAAMEGLQVITWLKDAGYPFSSEDPRVSTSESTPNFGLELDHYTLWLARVSILNLCRSGRFHINRALVDEKNRPRVAFNHDREIEFNPDEWIAKEVVAYLACPKSGYLTAFEFDSCVRNVRRAIAIHEIFSIIPSPIESNKYYPASSLVVDLHVGKDYVCAELRGAMWSHLRSRFVAIKKDSGNLIPVAKPPRPDGFTVVGLQRDNASAATATALTDASQAATQFARLSEDKISEFSRQLESLQLDATLLDDVYGRAHDPATAAAPPLKNDVTDYLRVVHELGDAINRVARSDMPDSD